MGSKKLFPAEVLQLSDIDAARFQSFNPLAMQNALALANMKDIKKARDGQRSLKSGKPSFSSVLKIKTFEVQNTEKTGEVQLEEGVGLSELLDEVHSAGDELKKHPLPDEIYRYKKAVKKFVCFVVKNSFTIKDSEGILNIYKPQYKNRKPEERNKRNKYKIITVIDQKLENMAAGILAGQSEQLKFLANIDEINGMIIDLLN
ncbi:MAG: YaaR family protein [Spirochaetaceae bacterium]|nr:YaaR family protein [Spirochaetaceae bacterium]